MIFLIKFRLLSNFVFKISCESERSIFENPKLGLFPYILEMGEPGIKNKVLTDPWNVLLSVKLFFKIRDNLLSDTLFSDFWVILVVLKNLLYNLTGLNLKISTHINNKAERKIIIFWSLVF